MIAMQLQWSKKKQQKKLSEVGKLKRFLLTMTKNCYFFLVVSTSITVPVSVPVSVPVPVTVPVSVPVPIPVTVPVPATA